MNNSIEVIILNNDQVSIDNQIYSGRDQISTIIQKLVTADVQSSVIIVPNDRTFFGGIAKVIYSATRAGTESQNLFYRFPDGRTVRVREIEPYQ